MSESKMGIFEMQGEQRSPAILGKEYKSILKRANLTKKHWQVSAHMAIERSVHNTESRWHHDSKSLIMSIIDLKQQSVI